MKARKIWTASLLGVFIGFNSTANAVDIEDFPVLQSLVKTMASEDGYPKSALIDTLAKANIDEQALALMDKQYESLPWFKYVKLFVNDRRINDGVNFWNSHEALLNQVNEKYGVPPRIMVALLGVETHYGERMGDKRVLDSLVTLSAAFPRRSKFFTKELRVFLNTTRNEGIDPTTVLGSFAGAIGIPQFMPSSYEAYSVDFNGNGRRDLVNEFEDAIGSVANYLSVHGWKREQSIYADVTESLSSAGKELVSKRAKPKLTQNTLRKAGVKYNSDGASDKVALLKLTKEQGHRYFVGYRNFYAITRYNPSVNYAMAIVELSESIAAKRGG